jgi:hypothetical protein
MLPSDPPRCRQGGGSRRPDLAVEIARFGAGIVWRARASGLPTQEQIAIWVAGTKPIFSFTISTIDRDTIHRLLERP